MKSVRTGIAPGSSQTFKIVFADLDTSNTTWIKPGAQLIINVPKEWTDVNVLSYPGFASTPTVTIFGDGSSQIVGTITSNLGDAANAADTIEFSAEAPNITNDQMYVMYVLAHKAKPTMFSQLVL